MKKIFFITTVSAACLLSACSSKKSEGGMSDQAKKNIEACNSVNRAMESGDVSKLGDFIAADGIDHTGMNGTEVKGLDSIKAELGSMKNYFDNIKFEVVNQVASDEWVYQWIRFTGKSKVDMMGMKKGDDITNDAVEVSKFNKDGKATDHWEFMTAQEFQKMMGGANQNMPMKDSTAKPENKM